MIVEIVTFRLADGVDEERFLAADHRVQTEYFYLQRGIVRRTTARGADGGWLVLTFWDSIEDADSAASALPEEYASLIDGTTIRTERYSTLD